MPFTHVEIEERESRNIAALFLFLIVLYAGSILVLVWGVKGLIGLGEFSEVVGVRLRPTLAELAVVFGLSLAFVAVHWMVSTHRLLDRVLIAVAARPINPDDTYHAKFANIVKEVSIATGGRAIESYVIPTTAMNACAVADFSGRAAIAVTEGALAILRREQLESVVGHEAAHIVSGDSLLSSVSCGLFAIHEEGFKRLSGFFQSENDRYLFRGRAALLAVFVMAVLWVTNWTKRACEMLISREKEYRADAIAVRLTRNPLSLAEALQLLSQRWRGVGTRGESLSSIFIVDPGTETFSEREGLLADLLSTHPPTERRIERLLGMAHLDPARFDEEMSASVQQKPVRSIPAPTSLDDGTGQWMIWSNERWIGPLDPTALAHLEDLRPESWVRRVNEASTQPAYKDPQLLGLLRTRYAVPGDSATQIECPHCRIPLARVLYEGTPIESCPACHGCYVDESTMTKLFAREEYGFSESTKRLGDALFAEEGYAIARKKFRAMPKNLTNWRCPRCGAAVVRKFYTENYPVEVEQCWSCGLAWLDQQKLELLQYLYEKRQALHSSFSDPP